MLAEPERGQQTSTVETGLWLQQGKATFDSERSIDADRYSARKIGVGTSLCSCCFDFGAQQTPW